ncbi:hypothetical protein F2P79_000865 [Pimephales promelas]|nr:hypothetical protein F2P79_000865 [Pimephales promelas]
MAIEVDNSVDQHPSRCRELHVREGTSTLHRRECCKLLYQTAGGSVWRQAVAMVRLPCGWCLTQTGPHTVSRRTRVSSHSSSYVNPW